MLMSDDLGQLREQRIWLGECSEKRFGGLEGDVRGMQRPEHIRVQCPVVGVICSDSLREPDEFLELPLEGAGQLWPPSRVGGRNRVKVEGLPERRISLEHPMEPRKLVLAQRLKTEEIGDAPLCSPDPIIRRRLQKPQQARQSLLAVSILRHHELDGTGIALLP
jgi:hypothetical protein